MPKHDGTVEGRSKVSAAGEIVMLRSDGRDFTVVPIPKGRNLSPVMSDDETKIAYWKSSAQRPPDNRLFLMDFDIWEYDLKTKQHGIFSGPFNFSEAGALQYISDDEVMISSYGPSQYAQAMGEYNRKFNNSQIYKLKRASTVLPFPSFTEISHANYFSADIHKNIYLEGESASEGISFYKISSSGNERWLRPYLGNIRSLKVSPDGRYMTFIYVAKNTRYVERLSAIGMVDLAKSEWIPMGMPPLRLSTPIEVR
jgi:hypothetical protein